MFTFVISSLKSYGEGTKQLEPDGPASMTNGGLGLILYDGGNTTYGYRIPFAMAGCDSLYRLNVYIANPATEKIYFGFRKGSYNQLYYQFRGPNGDVVPGYSFNPSPVAGEPGFIDDWQAAVNGPLTGYTPLILDPSTVGLPGNYYIEFAGSATGGGIGNDGVTINLIDISVVASGGTIIDGRVWSYAWQFSNQINGTSHAQNSDFYFYSNDGLTTKCNINSWGGGTFYVYCNQWGVYNTDNWENDRRSVDYTYGTAPLPLPQYREFLNPPDVNVYPTGTIGQICSGSLGSISYCDGSVDFIMKVTKTGIVTLNITTPSGSAIVQGEVTGYADCSTFDTIHWDGMINGTPVQNGASLSMSIQYLNGLTNLPCNDIETCNDGIKVDLVRPESAAGKLGIMWDDSNIPVPNAGVNSAYPGCIYPSSPAIDGCHSFSGDKRIINSWWYYLTTGNESLNIVTRNTPATPTVSPTGPSPVCQGQTGA
ncbi:MAG TPA: hypothetical protein PKI35_06455, partial [Bacteroidales bacterium]|nr:hypothetical protein [Bacteroidales bacterium]